MNSQPTPSPPAPLTPQRRGRRRWLWRLFERFSAVCWLLLILLAFTPVGDWLYRKLDCEDRLARGDYIVCLGGDPYRILESVTLLKEGYAPKLIVTNFGGAAEAMRRLAITWGAPPAQVLVDAASRRTADHPRGIAALGVDPHGDTCIIVSSFSHLARAKACFRKGGFEQLVMRAPRWERISPPSAWPTGFWTLPRLLYEYAAWVEYWMRGYV